MAPRLSPHLSPILPTARVTLLTHPLMIRALIDTGSQISLMSSACADKQNLRKHYHSTNLLGVGGSRLTASGTAVTTVIKHKGDPPFIPVTFAVVPKVSTQLPPSCVHQRRHWKHLSTLPLADPDWHKPDKVHVLLGTDVIPIILRPGFVQSLNSSPSALETSFGWVVLGSYGSPSRRRAHISFHWSVKDNEGKTNRNRLRTKYKLAARAAQLDHPYTDSNNSPETHQSKVQLRPHPLPEILEDISNPSVEISHPDNELSCALALTSPNSLSEDPPSTNSSCGVSEPADSCLTEAVHRMLDLEQVDCVNTPLSPLEQQCDLLYSSTVQRTATGRYIVHLPLVDQELGISRNAARRQFRRLEIRLNRDPILQEAYTLFMKDYLDQGHMTLVTSEHQPSYHPFYFPHHPVRRPNDPPSRIRVVFNGSCHTSNGKSLNDLSLIGPKLQADILCLLLSFRFHQHIIVTDIQQMYRQILIADHHRDFQRIIWKFPNEESPSEYRLNTVTYGHASAPYLALRTLKQLANDEGHNYPLAAPVLLNNGYVDYFFFGSNSISQALRVQQDFINICKAGGFELRKWMSNTPSLLAHLPPEHCKNHPSSSPEPPEVVSFDHDPVVKILGIGWHPSTDTLRYSVTVDKPATTKRTVLSQLARIFDPPGILSPVTHYARAIFKHLCMLGLDWDQQLPPSLLTTWSNFVISLPVLSHLQIPRLVDIDSPSSHHTIIGFCDASDRGYAAVICLHTIKNDHVSVSLLVSKAKVAPPKKVNTPRLELCGAHLLAKLFKKILPIFSIFPITAHLAFCDSTVTLAWIRGEPYRWKTFVSNRVADIQEILPPSHWRHVTTSDNPADCASRGIPPSELVDHPLWWQGPTWLRQPMSSWPSQPPHSPTPSEAAEEAAPISTVSFHVAADQLDLEHVYSSFTKLIRIVAIIRRFMHNITHRSQPILGPYTSSELKEATLCRVRSAQAQSFSDIIYETKNKDTKGRLIHQLGLFVDPDGLLSAGGRLRHNPAISYGTRHPLLLPKDHPLTTLIIDHAHLINLHAGTNSTHSYVRRQYWILDGKNVVRHRIGKCNRCFSVKPTPVIQPMGSLPRSRIEAEGPFNTVGVDYAKPFPISAAKVRGSVTLKAYVCLFVCFTTKAVHIELASSLSTDAFLAAYRRFAARRGHANAIFSDNGTNFVGASRELSTLLASTSFQNSVDRAASSSGTDWRFIPPGAPHFGGLWEAAVKSTKHHLRRIMGTQRLNYEEFYTLLAQTEAVLNSRPLCPLSSDPNDLEFLTPGHFLIHRPLTAPPDLNALTPPRSKLARWKLVQHLHQSFWKRWSSEYLHTLQQRTKWLTPSSIVSPGTIVIIKDDSTPPPFFGVWVVLPRFTLGQII